MVDWWIPVVAGFVGGLLPASVALLQLRAFGKQRSLDRKHEEGLQRSTQEHQRAERLRPVAAQAHSAGRAAVGIMSGSLFWVRRDPNEFDGPRFDSAVEEAGSLLRSITLDGWNAEMRASAKDANDAIIGMYETLHDIWAKAFDAGLEAADDPLVSAFEEYRDSAREHLETFRRDVVT